MTIPRQMTSSRLAATALAALLSLGGCATDYYGGMDVGMGYYGGSPWYDPYYAGYSGWYGDYYYPGYGYYVIDRSGRRHRWNDQQRSYWTQRRDAWRREHPERHDESGRPSRRDGDRQDRGADRGQPNYAPRTRQPEDNAGTTAPHSQWRGGDRQPDTSTASHDNRHQHRR